MFMIIYVKCFLVYFVLVYYFYTVLIKMEIQYFVYVFFYLGEWELKSGVFEKTMGRNND